MLGIVRLLFNDAGRQSQQKALLLKRWAHAGSVDGPSKEATSAIAFQVRRLHSGDSASAADQFLGEIVF